MLDDLAADVLAVVERIPPGRVMTYGDVAAVVGRGGARRVGTVLARYGDGCCWWRVLRAGGRPPAGLEAEALGHYRAEGTPLVAGADPARVDLGSARWYPVG